MSIDVVPTGVPVQNQAPSQTPEVVASATPVPAEPVPATPIPAEPASPADGPAAPAGENLETRAADRLHKLVMQGAEKLPGELGGTASRLAVALLVFGSEVARKDREKPAQAAVTEAVALFRSLEDDDAAQQRAALESALSTFVTTAVGQKEREAVLETAEEAITLWRRVTSGGAGLAKTDAAASLRELSGALRRTGRADAADETESEARRLEA